MSERRDEIKMELEWLDARDAFVAAKATREDDPKGYAKAKAKMSTLRAHWRGIGEFYGLRSPVGGINVGVNSTPEEG